MKEQRIQLSERLLEFCVSIVKLARVLRKEAIENHLGRQVLRSATSAGANYQEACCGESRADFIHKLQIALKELNETLFWLRLIEKSQVNISPRMIAVIQENKELCAILARSVVTAKTRSPTKL
jgi:four helix bundle protein